MALSYILPNDTFSHLYPIIGELDCEGTEYDIGQCPHSGWKRIYECKREAYVMCQGMLILYSKGRVTKVLEREFCTSFCTYHK